ncbi:DUF924 family protein [Pseudorhizobium pelagicum]|uniref:Membrane protein n=1 Tax=Pseudorhizobium pelagicum TaxID=1509405 RepID=A0A922P5C0_9HYPH|nr:DUF924 family protein [Pseudorhizobium pelagicum]KEQ08068.1 membrane protein [Pseudorhizobium pelagicum]KEQ10265.1 membrane protein [Pseudorhizobium pelagicum]
MTLETPQEILDFWFGRLTRQQWFQSSDTVDREIERRFRDTHLALARGEVEQWRDTPEHRLAAIIVLDQFPRNIYRATPLAFATDWMALREARLAVDAGADAAIAVERRAFVYLPFEHSEALEDQQRSVALFQALGDAEYLDYAERHLAVIREFGRFPHRNAYVGRKTTDAELEYLSKPGAGF